MRRFLSSRTGYCVVCLAIAAPAEIGFQWAVRAIGHGQGLVPMLLFAVPILLGLYVFARANGAD